MIQREDVLTLLVSRMPELATPDVVRCTDELVKSSEMRDDLPSLVKLQKATSEVQGLLVSQCLRAYQEHRTQPERALNAVYEWAQGKAPALYPPALNVAGDVSGAYARAKASANRSKAVDLYADCFMVFAEFVAVWNRKQMRLA